MAQTFDYAFFVEFEGRKFRLEYTYDLHKSRVYNSNRCLHAEVWHCPGRLGKNVIGFARSSRYLAKCGRKTFRSSRDWVRDAINEARWVTYKPILPSLLSLPPYSTLNAGPVKFGYIEVDFCPVKAAKAGIRRGIHPDAMFAGKNGLERIKKLAKDGDTISFFNETFELSRVIAAQDSKALDAYTTVIHSNWPDTMGIL